MNIQAYFEEWSLRAGDVARMAVRSPVHAEVRATFERLVGGPGDPRRPVMPTVPLPHVLDRRVRVEPPVTAVGSWAELPLRTPITSDVTVHVCFRPTRADLGADQVVLSLGGSARLDLRVRAGGLDVSGPDGSFRVLDRLPTREWLSVVLGLDLGSGSVSAHVRQVSGWPERSGMWAASGWTGTPHVSWLRMAAGEIHPRRGPREPFNGKIEAPTVHLGLLHEGLVDELHADRRSGRPVAAWDLSRDQHRDVLPAAAPGAADGRLRNGGDRGVTDHTWDGTSDSFREAPHQYEAIHFHDDDVLDAGWAPNLTFELPHDLESGVYLVRLAQGSDVDRYPLFVRPAHDAAQALFLLPTHTYLAYANDRLAAKDISTIIGHVPQVPEDELYVHDHPEFGLSCYDVHSDGSPVRYASRRRPLVNVRPGFRSWLTTSYRHFAADMYLLELLVRSGRSFDVATDEDLDRDGAALLDPYRTVVTGGHPEYWTGAARAALEDYLHGAGRLMYLGGNGAYWVTTQDPERPWIIEVRRDNSGTRCWDAPPGERAHTHTGEPGGLWRNRGKDPHRLFGIGFTSEGFASGQPYRRMPGSLVEPAASWFEGLDGECLGADGYQLGAAAADEIDRYDPLRGSPPDTQVLASASGFGVEYQVAIEDQLMGLPDQGGPGRPDGVRADMTYRRIAGGGEVFAVGSVAYAGALAWADFDNDLARLTLRVLDHLCRAPGA